MKRSWLRDLFPWLALALALLLLDQYTKQLILAHYQRGEGMELTSFLNIVRVHNAGAAFSFLAGESGWQRWFFVGIALAAVLVIVWMLLTHPGQRMLNFALACILGGAIGNVIDRVIHGYVVDFVDFHWDFLAPLFYRGHFPAFNVADTAITIGAVALIADELLRMRRPRR